VHTRAVVLATGGLGQIFSSTTNPAVSTGDGVAVALRAGAEVADLEFVQFHPTALWLGPDSRGQQPLITEAMRGEGAFLVDADGERVMTGVHPLADLAPRDVVAKAMSRRMAELRTDHLFLDARGIGETELLHHFPSIVARCRAAGVDPVTDPIPVAPAAHYASGGVITDLMGRTTVRGLYACGEVACTGVHGANRLASNSLLEGLVFAGRIGTALAADLPGLPETSAAEDLSPSSLLEPSAREEIQRAMTDGAGVLRSSHSLAATAKSLASVSTPRDGAADPTPAPDSWQTTDLHTVASAVVQAASMREETRGCHWREDHPDAEGAFLGHLVSRLAADGTLETEFRAGPGLSAIVSA
jgi:aspartate oxidase